MCVDIIIHIFIYLLENYTSRDKKLDKHCFR